MAIQIWKKGDKIKNDRFEILNQLGKGGFGITYLAEDTIYLSNSLGTELYKPIEQSEKRGQFGAYTDIYALAVTLYHLLTGAAPGGGSPLYRTHLRSFKRSSKIDKVEVMPVRRDRNAYQQHRLFQI
jgi:serine/threonine protein kinase